MRIEKELSGQVTVVKVSQVAINYNDLEKLQAELFKIIDGGVTKMVLDLSEVNTMDSFGVGVLMSAYRRMTKQGGTMKLCSIAPRVQSALSITKVDTVVEIHETVKGACASFGAGA
ncbi:MAG: STAS domain-containing protein [Acidobacteriota bacterium]